ncbi:magnesium citrate secondary transporter [Algoriphagus sp. AK58]|uniref:magnesium citrate secondary transporter n=1 Tax=Algoriphagus sp. AK58 TaxID=1406877 RepID=UPI001650AAA0|nr:magnesium citrate secondary transporter [Algoriphagus sp. AK58]MBC6365188.1 magnesium citrate secondary transporter [Algoriphagus sp. AK58]
MSVIRNPYFSIPVVLFSINQVFEKVFGVFIPWIHAYLDDLLAIPVILGITLQIYQWIHPLRQNFRFKKEHVFVAFLYVSIVFEGFLPWYSNLYVRDFWDIVCYAFGSLVFYFKINR